jgi:hypothetical protein
MGRDCCLRRTLIRCYFNAISTLFQECFNHASNDRPGANATRGAGTGGWQPIDHELRRGEHGVKVTTWIPTERKERDETTGEEKVRTGRICHTAVVFHVSQTDPIAT